MRSLPPHMLALACPEMTREQLDAFADCGVRVGLRTELDLDQVRTRDPEVTARLLAYDQRTRDFWDRYVEGGSAGKCVVTRRPLSTYTKVDNKRAKVYLKDQVEELVQLAGHGDAVAALLGNPDAELPTGALEAVRDGSITHATLRVPGRRPWAAALGGAQGRGEVARVFELKVSHAKSHDRRNQRLLELRVLVEEVWPA